MAGAIAISAGAQMTIYSCPDKSYTNSAQEAAARGCRAISAAPVDVDTTLPSPKRDLGFIDRWRYESCMQDAAKMPTEAGVRVAATSCNRQFGQ